MKTRFFICLAAIAAICFGGQSLRAQYPGQFGPGYGLPAPGGMVPTRHPPMMPEPPMGPNAFLQDAPYGAPVAFIPASPAEPFVPARSEAFISASTEEASLPASPETAPPPQFTQVGHQVDCGGKGCEHGCDSCTKKGDKGKGSSSHGLEFYGEFLYLRARDAEVAYAVPFNGPVTPPPASEPVEVGPVGVLDMDFQPSYRAGFNKIVNDCTRISAEYMMYESGTTDQTLRGSDPMYVVHSLVSHPSTGSSGNSYTQADGQYDLSMDMVNVDLRRLFYDECDLKIGWVLGVLAAQQEQTMLVSFTGSGTETVTTDVDFNGVGVKLGLDGETTLVDRWLAYANFSGSFVPGVFSADFNQSRNAVVEVDTGWESGRIVTIWDFELGISRISRCGKYRLNAGYMFSAWTNAVQTDEWIDAVHTSNFIGLDSTMTFDGLVGRFEIRY